MKLKSDEKKIIREIQERVEYQLTHTWANSINITQRDSFLNNFEDEDKILGWVLLDILLFHNQAQEKQLMKSLLHKLESSMYKKYYPKQDGRSDEIESFLKEKIKDACFIPVIDENPADSSNAWASIVRDSTGTSNNFYTPEQIPLLLAIQKENYIFFDDMLGTGTQFSNFLNKRRFALNGRKKLSIIDLFKKNPEKNYYYLCMAAHKDGIDHVRSLFDKIEIIVAEQFDGSDNILIKG